ncbi:hypothetical protein BB560_001214 [Smittium megazygosporum]|uniref:Uncharacterized protein n=1 Tax=Smittium megazygosporum TaxID=133381 RepID=A0A2T9ZI85_9FUNG|nr:hypothetical protein BB560_001214 [Smittium megazygosporum]
MPKIGDALEGKKTALIGTIYLHQPNKPSILDEVSKSQWEDDTAFPDKYFSDNDEIWLEDESGRILLDLSNLSDVPTIVTGMILAFLGTISVAGAFIVEDHMDSGLPIQKPIDSAYTKDGEKYIAFISGINSTISEPAYLQMKMLIDFLSGASSTDNAKSLARSISCLVIAGNSIDYNDNNDDFVAYKESKFGFSNTNENAVSSIVSKEKLSIETVDSFIYQLSHLLPVLIMPGSTDPVSDILPQPPMPVDILLPRSSQMTSLYSLGNPCWFSADNISFLGSSGQNVEDILRCIDKKTPVEVAKSTLTSRHLFPTCPDTLRNQDSFSRKELFEGDNKKVLIITIPKFKTSDQIVLLNLFDFTTKIVSFGS